MKFIHLQIKCLAGKDLIIFMGLFYSSFIYYELNEIK